MDKSNARALLPLVNDVDKYDVLMGYLDSRIEILRGYLENTKEFEKIIDLQGAIAEIRRMKTLREQAIEGAK
jgi:hypothetical protein